MDGTIDRTREGDRLAVPERALPVVPERALDGEELHRAGSVQLARLLAERVSALGRAEVELVRQEARADLKRGLTVGGIAGASGVLLIAALCCGLVAAILAIGTMLSPVWVAVFGACLFAALATAVGLAAASEARHLRPERSLRQAKATVELLRHPFAPARR